MFVTLLVLSGVVGALVAPPVLANVKIDPSRGGGAPRERDDRGRPAVRRGGDSIAGAVARVARAGESV